MIDKNIVRGIIESYFVDSDKYLTELEVKSDNKILVEIDSDTSISIEDCILLTKHIESKLNRDDEDYELEVGSAGISQPFKTLRQYKKNIGNEVEVLAKDGKKYSGVLKDANDKNIVLSIEKKIKPEGAKRKITVNEEIEFTYEEIKFTKYIIRFK
ncbi:ribosome maturation factor RimP [Dysgonomonadaceae bacterium PH5-43]|nr:ribosome maturation factor RimP [Dysgonomonadaceae bacterium PH5-43]